jgi:hypothetical protein
MQRPVSPPRLWPRGVPPSAAALDPDLLADLVNEALIEQARRHGANLP